MNKLILTTAIIFTTITATFAQVSGNQVFDRNNNSRNVQKGGVTKLYLSDSAFIVQAKVLKNVKADYYIAAFGLSQEAATVTGGNTQINARIKSFIDNIKKSGINEQDIYTDMIAQYRVYDLKRNVRNAIAEYLKGYELSKNVIVKYNKPAQIEQLLTLASRDSIFDLIKVDYMVDDVSRVYDELFQAATEVIKKKKDLYVKLTSANILPEAQIYGEEFISYYPDGMYRNYKAFSSNFYESYSGENERKEAMKKFETFYYDKIDYSGFDKIINPSVLEPVVEFGLTLQVKYNIKPAR
ncbi:MAG: SIMPL domain-containing protein [Chitinophagaceae bacterium]